MRNKYVFSILFHASFYFIAFLALGQESLLQIEEEIQKSKKHSEKQILRIIESLEYWVDEDVESVNKLLSKISPNNSNYLQARIDLLYAEIYIRKKQDTLAQKKIDAVSDFFTKHNQNDFRFIYVQVLQHRLRDDFENAKNILEKALLRQENYSLEENTLLLIELGLTNLLMNNYSEALKILSKAEEKTEKAKFSKYFLRIYNLRGLIYKNTNYRALALENYQKSIKIINNENIVSKSAAIIFMNLGNLYAQQDDTLYYQKGIEAFEQGLKMSEKLKDTVQIIHFQERLGAIHLMQNQTSKAFSYFEKSLMLAEAMRSQYMKILLLVTIATSYKHIGNIEKAEKMLLKSLNEAKIYEKHNLYIEACLYLSELYQSVKNFEKSITYFQMGLAASQKQKISFFLPDLYFYASFAYMNMGKYKDAERIISEMEKLENRNLQQIYTIKMQKDSMQNNFTGAFYWARKLELLKDSLHQQEKRDNFNENIEKMILDELKEEKAKRILQEQQEKSGQQKNLLLGLTMLFAILVLIVIFFYERRRKNKWQKFSYQLQLREKDLEQVGKELQINFQKLKSKSEFDKKLLAIISHDLRGPLSSVAAMMDLLAQDHQENVTLHEYLQVSKDTLYASLELLENLVFWAKVNQFDFEVNYEKVKLYDFVEQAIGITTLQAKQKNLEIHNLIDKNFTCLVEPNTIKLVLRNLVSNAIKFTEKGKITINAFIENDTCKLAVADTGVGISPTNLQKLFQKTFATLGTNKEKGTGLGLLLSKEFLEKIGGSISVQSELNVGTTFTIELPKKLL